MSVDKRFDQIRVHLNFKNWTDFARYFGYNDNQIRSYRKEIADIPRDLEKKMSNIGINVDWLLTGVGEMLTSRSQQNVPQVKEHTVSDTFVNDILNIKLYNMPVHANIGTAVQFEDMAFSYKPLSVGLKLDPNKCIGLHVVGDSMIDAQITSGSIIIVETGSKIIDGDRVVLNHNGTLIVKYFRNCKDCEIEECQNCKFKFRLYSRNHGEHMYDLSAEDEVVIIGKVKLVIQY